VRQDGAFERLFEVSWPHVYNCVFSYTVNSGEHAMEQPVTEDVQNEQRSVLTAAPCEKSKVSVAANFAGLRGAPIEKNFNSPPEMTNISLNANGSAALFWDLSPLDYCAHVLRAREALTAHFRDDERRVDESIEALRREVEYFQGFGLSIFTSEEASEALRRHGAPVEPCRHFIFALNVTVEMEGGDSSSEGPSREFAAGRVQATSDEHHGLNFGAVELSQECQRRREEEAEREREGKTLDEVGDEEDVKYDDEGEEEEEGASGEDDDYLYVYDEDKRQVTLVQEYQDSGSSLSIIIPVMILLVALLALAILAAFAVLARRRGSPEDAGRGDESAVKEFDHLCLEEGGDANGAIIRGTTTT